MNLGHVVLFDLFVLVNRSQYFVLPNPIIVIRPWLIYLIESNPRYLSSIFTSDIRVDVMTLTYIHT